MDYTVAAVVWFVCALAAYAIAKAKGAPNVGTWTLLGFFFGPFGVIGALIFAKPATITSAAPTAWVATPGVAGGSAFCPNCGTQRVGAFQFCRSCGFDFDAATPPPAQAWGGAPPLPTGGPAPAGSASAWEQRAAAPQASSGNGLRLALIAIVVVAIGGAALYWANSNSRDILTRVETALQTPTQADTPPLGAIWFGSTFDPDTLAIRGRTTSTDPSKSLAAVGQLTKTMNGDELNMRLSFDGTVVSNQALGWSGSGDLWGWTLSPLLAAGDWKVELTDIGGNVLSGGTVTVTD